MTACSRSLNSDWHVPVPYSCTGTGRESSMGISRLSSIAFLASQSIIDDLTEADMELELGQIEVNDAHLADALAGLSDDEFQ